ncbi:MAG: NUDIX domain-containing protein, partial [Nitrosopumilaceae archaeon]|nr:NUDIX domain-containing protein [Nitrosopumilaceae archaeon]NIU86933.1 NUDIX domain-containing protein [Nitrosopumilaceae archaeon]NIV66319.1 NUDIX domain-containing protein [Nitrosopumilaceae archaeon]NIX61149.1 NUDIX domain-containing protein [Nitrosopumilaceae archaeon]
MIEERSAGIVIFRDEGGKKLFLLLHYPSGHWDFVKGKIEKNENPREAAIREAREETGIKQLDFIESFEETIEYNYQFEGKLVHKEVVFFLAATSEIAV